MKPVTRPPRKPAPTRRPDAPPTKPGTRPGRSAMAKAMKPESTGTRKPKASRRSTNSSAGPVHARRRSWKSLTAVRARRSTSSRCRRQRDLVPAEQEARAIRMPPAATNGIMYDTPVISHCRTLVPTPATGRTLVGRRRRGCAAAAACCRARARHVRRGSTAATAAAITPGASCTAFLTPTSTNGLPANRSLSRTSRSAAKMTPSAAAMIARIERDRARGTLGLDLDLVAGGLAGLLQGLGGHVGVRDARRARRDGDELH